MKAETDPGKKEKRFRGRERLNTGRLPLLARGTPSRRFLPVRFSQTHKDAASAAAAPASCGPGPQSHGLSSRISAARAFAAVSFSSEVCLSATPCGAAGAPVPRRWHCSHSSTSSSLVQPSWHSINSSSGTLQRPVPVHEVRTKSNDSKSSSAYASRHQAAEQRRRTRINERCASS